MDRSPCACEPLDRRLHLSGDEFGNLWEKAQAIISGEYFIQFGDTSPSDQHLTYAEQFAKYKSSVTDTNNDGRVDANDLKTPGRTQNAAIKECRSYPDHVKVDWYETNRAAGAKAWMNAEGTLAVSASGDVRVELSGTSYVKVTERGVQIGRFAAKGVKRIDVFGSSGNDVIRLGDALTKPTTVWARAGHDTVWGGDGGETIYGGDGNDEIHGGSGDDLIYGYNGDDRLWGDGGADRLEGNSGKDRLDGGGGVDKLSGGSGIDSITLRAKDRRDSDPNDRVTILA